MTVRLEGGEVVAAEYSAIKRRPMRTEAREGARCGWSSGVNGQSTAWRWPGRGSTWQPEAQEMPGCLDVASRDRGAAWLRQGGVPLVVAAVARASQLRSLGSLARRLAAFPKYHRARPHLSEYCCARHHHAACRIHAVPPRSTSQVCVDRAPYLSRWVSENSSPPVASRTARCNR